MGDGVRRTRNSELVLSNSEFKASLDHKRKKERERERTVTEPEGVSPYDCCNKQGQMRWIKNNKGLETWLRALAVSRRT